MKVSALAILLISANLLDAHPSMGQDFEKKISINLQNKTIAQALQQLTEKTGVEISYRSQDLAAHTIVTHTEVRDKNIIQALEYLLGDRKYNIVRLQEHILIKKNLQYQMDQWSGTIVDERGHPMVGVSVHLKGLPGAVVTDAYGHFVIKGQDKATTLVISYVGYQTREIALSELDGKQPVKMQPDLGMLDEVAVIGYGTTTKRANTSSISSITAKDISQQPISNPMLALQGRIPGMEINTTNGLTGSNLSVRIRGISSAESLNEPLYVIDGVPYFSAPMNDLNGAAGKLSPMAGINPNDIERIDILKDADATSIYGSRAANGVVLITTKKGKAGKLKTDFDVYTGSGKVPNKVDMLNVDQYLELRKQTLAFDGVTADPEKHPDILTWDRANVTDWQKTLIGNSAKMTEAKVTLSAGDEHTTFLMSGTYRKETSPLIGDGDYKKGAARMAIDHTTDNRKFKISGTIGYNNDNNSTMITDLTQYYNLAPHMPVYNPDGSYYWYGNVQNPFALKDRTYEAKTKTLLSSANLRYTPIAHLNIGANIGYTDTRMDIVQTLPDKTFNPLSSPGSYSTFNNSTNTTYIIEPQADYTLHFKNSKSKLNILAGGTWQESRREATVQEASGFTSDSQLENIKAASKVLVKNYTYTQYRYQAVFGRATYNIQDRYIVNGTVRRDGSSRFGPNKRFGTFASLGAAWVFSEEAFIKDLVPALSFGKLRGSYGSTGNDQIGDYSFLDSWAYTSFGYDGITGITPARVYNPDYSWERNRKSEIALELGFLSNRIVFNTNYYHNQSDNQLLQYVLSAQTGFDGYLTNLPALIVNKGLELELSTVNYRKEKFSWNSSLNMTIPSNKLKEYPNLIGSSNESRFMIGQPLSLTKGYRFLSVDPQTGLPIFEDRNGDGIITAGIDDQFALGSDIPTFYGGFNNSLTYKNLSVDVLLQFVKQTGPSLNYGYSAINSLGMMSNMDLIALDRWQQAGDITTVPKPSATPTTDAYKQYNNQYRLSSAYWDDASFIRLKNLSVRYDLTAALSKWNLQRASVYLMGNNLLTWTKYKGFDPETKGRAVPPMRVYTIGLQIGL